jgi:protein phosphatase 2C family protein 2/3
MGDTLSKPITEKHSQKFENEHVKVGASGMQGWRRGMEDAHLCLLQLEDAGQYSDHSLYGVFDGHCGATTAKFCGVNLQNLLLQELQATEGKYVESIQNAFLKLDASILEQNQKHDGSGCTAVCALLSPTKIYVGNAGDSRCVLCRDGKAVPLSEDHKPFLEKEIKRIQKAGGFVQAGRVNGNLALSRAVGDFDFKQNKNLSPEEQAITVFPDVTSIDLTEEDEFLILACDGIWDVMSNEDVCMFVRKELMNNNEDLASICEAVFDKCLAPCAPGLGCDNMTMIIILFHRNWQKRK